MPSAAVDLATVAAPPTTLYGQVRADYLLQAAQTNPSVLFIGDSIIDWFANGAGASVWNAQLAPLGAADYGDAGSTTQNLLWEIGKGELNGLSPKVVVLEVGVNNLIAGESPQQAAAGIAATVAALRAAEPQAQILVLGMLPTATDTQYGLNANINQTNALVAGTYSGTGVHYLDPGAAFLQSDGSVTPGLLGDGIHPSAQGYALLNSLIQPAIQALLTPPAPAPTPASLPAAPAPSSSPAAPPPAPNPAPEATLTNAQLLIAVDQSAAPSTPAAVPADAAIVLPVPQLDVTAWWGTFSPE